MAFIWQAPFIGLFIIPYLSSIDSAEEEERYYEEEEKAKKEIVELFNSTNKEMLEIKPIDMLPSNIAEYFLKNCNGVSTYWAKLDYTIDGKIGIFIYASNKDNSDNKSIYPSKITSFSYIKEHFNFII